MNGWEFDDWYDYGIYAVARMGEKDRDRIEIQKESRHRETAYQAALSALTEEQREAVEAYMISLENLEYQNSRLAYELGKRVGRGLAEPKMGGK